MSGLDLTIDASDIARAIGARFQGIARSKPGVFSLALNRTGDTALSWVRRALPAQTGLKRAVFTRAITSIKSSSGSLTYTIKSHGGNVRLKYFGARETRRGVSAAPWNARQVFAGTFIKGGRFPNRVTARGLNGQVYRRTGQGRAIAVVRSGLLIPTEMVTGASAAAFNAAVVSELPKRLDHELARLLGGG